jgi:hypothetical protein
MVNFQRASVFVSSFTDIGTATCCTLVDVADSIFHHPEPLGEVADGEMVSTFETSYASGGCGCFSTKAIKFLRAQPFFTKKLLLSLLFGCE